MKLEVLMTVELMFSTFDRTIGALLAIGCSLLIMRPTFDSDARLPALSTAHSQRILEDFLLKFC